MGQIGFSEMLVIFIVALLVFGPKKLPELGKSLGKGIREFRKATEELKSTWEDQVRDIQAPLNDVKRDLHDMGNDMKTSIYNSIEAETSATPAPDAPAQALALSGQTVDGMPSEPEKAAAASAPAPSSSQPEESLPKEHV